jgi:ribosomal protein S18 acetylase RimI-like enzyme
MEADLDEGSARPELPAGIEVRVAEAGDDLRPFYLTVDEGMADHWGYISIPYEEWVERRTGATFDPTLWFLAVDGQELAGAALCSISEDRGLVDTLVVRRAYRRRGLGLALLQYAFAELARRDLRRVRLSVDSESLTGATRLYERAGMHVAQEHAAYSKELRAGVEGDG